MVAKKTDSNASNASNPYNAQARITVVLDGKKMSIKLRPDDSIARVRRKIAASISLSNPNDLCFWTTVRVGHLDDVVGEIVSAAQRSGTSPGTGSGRHESGIKQSDLARATANLVGSKIKPKSMHHQHDAAVDLVSKWLSGSVEGTIPVGARWANVRSLRSDGSYSASAWWSFPMELGSADPFLSSRASDVDAADLSRGLVPWTEGESWLLEDYLKDRGVLYAATRESVAAHAHAQTKEKEKEKEKGNLDFYFPLSSSSSFSPAPQDAAVRSWDEYADATMDALDSFPSTTSVDVSTTLLNCSTRMGSQGSSDAHFDTDSLYELFARLEASHEVPCLVFHDGSSPTMKVFKDAIQTHEGGDLPASVLRRWKREAIGDRRRASLRAYCAVHKTLRPGESQQYASYVLNADLSAHILASGLGRDGPQRPEEQRASLRRVGDAVDEHVVSRIESLMRASDVRVALRSARIAMEQRQPLQKMSFRVTLSAKREAGAIPSVAEIQSVVSGRLSAVLTLVATVSGGKTIFFYGRVAFASKIQRAQLVARLMSGRPKAEIEREMIGTFAMSPEDAKSFVEVQSATTSYDEIQPLYQGPVSYRMESVPVIELRPLGGIGYEATIVNVARIEYVERINRLLTLLVAEKRLSTRLPEMPYDVFASSSSSSYPKKSSEPEDDAKHEDAKHEDAKHEDAKHEDDEELDQWLDDEISGLDSPDPPMNSPYGDVNPLDAMDAQDEKEERKVEEEDEGNPERDEENDDENLQNPQNHLLSMLRKADRTLFKYPGSRYATDCARNMMRQPVVLSRADLERTNKLYPGGHTGAIVNYGTTPDKAAENAYICPEVWCPRSKVALTREQFDKLGKKCPGGEGDEDPIVFDSKYWDSKEKNKNNRGHNPGFLDRRKHPGGFCMPCCFIKPQQHFDRCGANLEVEKSVASKKKSEEQERGPNDTKYIRGAEVWPLEPGRYGMLPGVLAEALLGSKPKCGNRDDGSGQLMVTSHCFVRRGISFDESKESDASRQFVECAAYVLGHASGESMMKIVNESLSASVFLTLDGGRVARRWMDGLDPIELFETPGVVADVAEWLNAGSKEYVERFGLEKVASEASDASKKARGPSPEFLREIMVRTAMRMYLESWGASGASRAIRKIAPQSDGMLDLLSRPHPRINPNAVNLILLESVGGGLTVTVPCAPDGVDVVSRWRAKDPVGMILSLERSHYEPIVSTSLVRGGVHETRTFFADAHPRLATLVRGYLGACATRGRERVSGIVWALKSVGYRVSKQIVDCFFRLAGLVAVSPTDEIFVPLLGMNLPVLAGDVGSGLGIAYLGDVVEMGPFKRPPAHREVAIVESMFAKLSETSRVTGLRPRDRITDPQGNVVALRLANGGIVPLVARALLGQSLQFGKERVHAAQYLEHLSTLVEVRPAENAATEWTDRWNLKEKRAWELKSRVVRALRADGSLSSELVALRSSLHPFDIDSKRREAVRVIGEALREVGKKDEDVIEELADAMLFGAKPLSLRRDEIKIEDDGKDRAIVFSESELLAGELDVLIQSLEMIRPPNEPGNAEMDLMSRTSAIAQPSAAPSASARASLSARDKRKGKEEKKPDAPFPLDEDALVRYVGHQERMVDDKSRGNAHRSSTYKQRRVRLVTNVDVYAAVHLAHQMLYTDAPARLEDTVRAVQNAVMSALISGDLDQNSLDGTLGKMLVQQQKNRPFRRENDTRRQYVAGKLASAIAWRGPEYVTSTFEIGELSKFLQVDVRLIPPNQSRALVSAVTSSSRKSRSSKTSKTKSAKNIKQYVILVEQPEGRGHSLALSPSASVSPGAGHRILFNTPIA